MSEPSSGPTIMKSFVGHVATSQVDFVTNEDDRSAHVLVSRAPSDETCLSKTYTLTPRERIVGSQ